MSSCRCGVFKQPLFTRIYTVEVNGQVITCYEPTAALQQHIQRHYDQQQGLVPTIRRETTV